MRKLFVVLFSVLVIAACDRGDNSNIQQCGGYDVQIEISDEGETMHANINGDELDLSHVVSASGAKYAGILNDTVVVLWSKGDAWTMMLDDEQIIDCQAK